MKTNFTITVSTQERDAWEALQAHLKLQSRTQLMRFALRHLGEAAGIEMPAVVKPTGRPPRRRDGARR